MALRCRRRACLLLGVKRTFLIRALMCCTVLERTMSGDARQCRWHALECVRLAHTLSLRRSKRCPGSTQSRCGYPSGRSEWQTVSIAVRTAAAKAPKDRVLLDGAIKLDLTPLVISSWTPRPRRPRLQIFLVFVPCRSRSSSMLVVIPAPSSRSRIASRNSKSRPPK